MVRSGLILGAVALLVAAGATLISPICVPCIAIFLGLAAGYVAGVFDRPASSSSTSKVGAIGGALAGVGAILGQVVGALINSSIIGPAGLQNIYQKLGVPTSGMDITQVYWIATVGGTLCFSVIDIILMAAFGAVGALLWWNTTGKNAAPHPA